MVRLVVVLLAGAVAEHNPAEVLLAGVQNHRLVAGALDAVLADLVAENNLAAVAEQDVVAGLAAEHKLAEVLLAGVQIHLVANPLRLKAIAP